MELKRYDDFSELKNIETRIEDIIDLFPNMDDIIDIFYSLDGLILKSIIPTLYKGNLFYRDWSGGVLIDSYSYFNMDKTGDRYKIEELYLQEIIYPKKEWEEWFTQKWRSFSLKFFEMKGDKLKSKESLAPCFKVELNIEDSSINRYNFKENKDFTKVISEMRKYLESNNLKWILLSDIKDSKLKIIVISNKYIRD